MEQETAPCGLEISDVWFDDDGHPQISWEEVQSDEDVEMLREAVEDITVSDFPSAEQLNSFSQ